MPSVSVVITGTIAGITMQGTTTRNYETPLGHQDDLPAAAAGTLSTRTNNTDGTLTLGAGHGVSTGDRIDIFWTDAAGLAQAAYGLTVGTVAGTSVPFTGANFLSASGDATVLPAQDFAITADVCRSFASPDFDGDDATVIMALSTRKGFLCIVDNSTGATVLHAQRLAANEPWIWFNGQGVTSPLTGNPVDTIYVSNGDSSNAATFKMGVQLDT